MPNVSPLKIAPLWATLKPLAPAAPASNARLATNGHASNQIRKSVSNTVSPKPVPKLDKWEKEEAALISINNAIAKILTNTPAPAPDTPVAQAQPATVNTPNVPAHPAMSGQMELVSNN